MVVCRSDGGVSMIRRGRYLYECPACGKLTFTPRLGRVPGKSRDVQSLVDGQTYPSCRRVEQLCFWCEVERWGENGGMPLAFPTVAANAAGSASSTSSALDAGPLKPFPELWDFLTTSTLPDGGKRLTGRLSVCFESNVLRLSLTDDHTRQYATLCGRDLSDLLTEAELRLVDGSLPWRPSGFVKGKKK